MFSSRRKCRRLQLALLATLGVVGGKAIAKTAPSLQPPKITAKAALVLHNRTGKALYAKNADEVRSIASLTKLQAALVVRRRGLDLKKGTTITRDDHRVAVRGARTRLELKWTYRNIDLLHAALMSSDNRATSALGRAVKLSSNGLVQAMNELARRQGLSKTVFRGPVGIDHGNQSNCWEVAKIARHAAKDEILRKVMGKREYRVKPLRGYLKVYYRNTNALVGKDPAMRFLASKTGYNDRAGYSLAAVVKLRELGEVTVVLLGSKSKLTRVQDERKLLRWARRGGIKLVRSLP